MASLLDSLIDRISPQAAKPGRADDRFELLTRALYLSVASVVAGALLGTAAVVVGLLEASASVLGSGLGLLADLTGSVVLVWRFHTERRAPFHAERVERQAAVVVAVALFVVSVAIAAEAIIALVDHEPPGASWVSLMVAGIAVVVLPPLALAKRSTATHLGSHALRGDSSITAVGAGTALIALIGLGLFHAFGWWWTDRVAALAVAVVAASEGIEVLRELRASERV